AQWKAKEMKGLKSCTLLVTLAIASDCMAQLVPPGGGTNGCTNCPPIVWNTNRNGFKFMDQVFLRVDTNDAAANDAALYNACSAFPASTNNQPDLQIRNYGTNALLIKASHFDYSAETDRDFALLVCDKAETPLWKLLSPVPA